MSTKIKISSYSDGYIEYGFYFVVDRGVQKPQCVVCHEVLANSSMKPAKLKRHIEQKHPDLNNHPGKLDIFKRKREILKRSRLDDTGDVQKSQKGLLLASFQIAYRIAKTKKPHSIGETLILPCIRDAVTSVLGPDSSKKLASIPLSDNTVQRRIVAMSDDIKNQVVSDIKSSPFHAIALDESTDVASCSQLLVYVRYIKDDELRQEFLMCRDLKATTKGEDVYEKVKDFYTEEGLPFNKLVGSTTDGAPAMLGRHSGFQAYLARQAPNVLQTHCWLHREALASRTLPPPLKEVLQLAIKIVNYIKSSALNTRLFRLFCEDMDASHLNLLFHTSVRWLSCGRMLGRVYELRDELTEFLKIQQKDDWASLFKDADWTAKLIYLTDMFEKLNKLNSSFQGEDTNIMILHDKMQAFVANLKLLIQRLSTKRFALLPRLSEFIEANENFKTDEIITLISSHVRSLITELDKYFPEQKRDELTSVFSIIKDPFQGPDASDNDNDSILEEMNILRFDSDAKIVFKQVNLINFWCTMRHTYQNLADQALKVLLPFATTYACESGFSSMVVIKTKFRNRLELEPDFRCALAHTEPRIEELVLKQQQQASH